MRSDPRNIQMKDYTYELPASRIAMYPLEQRDASQLLVYNIGGIHKSVFSNLSDYLPEGSLMVFNNTRVVQARLVFRKESGAVIEVFCLEPAGQVRDIQLAFQQKNSCSWFCLVGNAKKWKHGPLEMTVADDLTLTVTKGEQVRDGYQVDFQWNGDLTFAELLQQAGKTPLPPYIGRRAGEEDKIRYQTIFAQHSGSVAAPTSGLHFTETVMDDLAKKQIKTANLTLHVGAGTFKPVSSDTIVDHQMHHEQVIVPLQSLKSLIEGLDHNVISVGTTSLRTLESLYWLGVKMLQGYTFGDDGFVIHQWEPYDTDPRYLCSAQQALLALVDYMELNKLAEIKGETSLIIVPGYEIKTANMLITNFHQPGSTLLLLVAAFCGEDWRIIYNFAMDNDFRFLSYGDSCLMIRDKN
jgi:S-adenosylmethionine:tRNA ribosyltransferase-isomerase